jgi:hypothetical protein
VFTNRLQKDNPWVSLLLFRLWECLRAGATANSLRGGISGAIGVKTFEEVKLYAVGTKRLRRQTIFARPIGGRLDRRKSLGRGTKPDPNLPVQQAISFRRPRGHDHPALRCL